jgi:alkylation response protein AidB-like acyl-CoA dehydrogenase
MDFAFTEEQEALRRTVRQLLATVSTSRDVRAAMATEAGWDERVWARLGGELGLTALLIPEAYGGAGLGHVELCAVMEEMGRALLCAPFLSTVALGAVALLRAGSEEQKQRWLPGIAAGATRVALAVAEAGGRGEAGAVTAVAAREGAEYVLTGEKSFVVDGHTAELLLVAARAPGSAGDEGVSLFAVPGAADGLARRVLPTLDMTRKLAEVRLAGVRVPVSHRLGAEGDAAAALAHTLDLAAIALAAEQVGGAERCLEMAVEHAQVRRQFGRAIGSFQAIKHRCADMLVRVESARSASYHAGWAAAAEAPGLPVAAALAKAYASEAFFHCAAENIQIHGGIGFTWEHDAHLYFKRARAGQGMFGAPGEHRERVARALGL